MTTRSLSNVVHDFVISQAEKFEPVALKTSGKIACWTEMRKLGTRLWLDTGDIEQAAALWNPDFEALTTNNTLLNKEIQKGIYDDLIKNAVNTIRNNFPELDEKTLILETGFILNACHGLRLVRQFNAHVSVELHTDLAHDVKRALEYGRRFFAICPENFYIKAPFASAGLIIAGTLQREGIPINFTLGFSARQNYLAACVANTSFVNVFMGRLNAFVSDNHLGDGKNVGEKATLATQRALIELRQQGTAKSLLIGASMRDGGQVKALAGMDVMTMPVKVAAQFADNPAGNLVVGIAVDPPVECLTDAVNKLWDIPGDFKKCVHTLAENELSSQSAESIEKYFQSRGFGDLFPQWSQEQIKTVIADGKIPVYEHWRNELENNLIGLDALMNVSALYSFVADQQALDARIKNMI